MKEKKTKNNGTDQKKDDGSSKEMNATDRSCTIVIVNNSGSTITDVTLKHTSGDTNSEIKMPTMANGEESYPLGINFETGWWADFDYWNINFKIGNTIYDTPYNDRCNISYEDAGGIIKCEISKETHFGGDYNLKIHMPKSSSCNFNIDKK